MFKAILQARARKAQDATERATYLRAQKYLTQQEFSDYYGMCMANAMAGPYPANDLEIARLDKVAVIREQEQGR